MGLESQSLKEGFRANTHQLKPAYPCNFFQLILVYFEDQSPGVQECHPHFGELASPPALKITQTNMHMCN